MIHSLDTRRRIGSVILGLVVAFSAHAQAPASAKRPLALHDLYRFDGPRSLVVAPDGKSAAYIRQWIDTTTRQDRHSLWLVEGQRDKVRPREQGEPDARMAIFSPDGRWLAVLSTRPRPAGWKQTPPVPLQSEPALDIWLMPRDGGPAIPLAGSDKPYGRVFNDNFYGR